MLIRAATQRIFLSTLSLRRATIRGRCSIVIGGFLSTLSLRRATASDISTRREASISIHALLAESDGFLIMLGGFAVDFYPRSPCGERLFEYIQAGTGILFLSTLSLRRATVNEDRYGQQYWNFYPRSPCGERLSFVLYDTTSLIFLSTLSLRRATYWVLQS